MCKRYHNSFSALLTRVSITGFLVLGLTMPIQGKGAFYSRDKIKDSTKNSSCFKKRKGLRGVSSWVASKIKSPMRKSKNEEKYYNEEGLRSLVIQANKIYSASRKGKQIDKLCKTSNSLMSYLLRDESACFQTAKTILDMNEDGSLCGSEEVTLGDIEQRVKKDCKAVVAVSHHQVMSMAQTGQSLIKRMFSDSDDEKMKKKTLWKIRMAFKAITQPKKFQHDGQRNLLKMLSKGKSFRPTTKNRTPIGLLEAAKKTSSVIGEKLPHSEKTQPLSHKLISSNDTRQAHLALIRDPKKTLVGTQTNDRSVPIIPSASDYKKQKHLAEIRNPSIVLKESQTDDRSSPVVPSKESDLSLV